MSKIWEIVLLPYQTNQNFIPEPFLMLFVHSNKTI